MRIGYARVSTEDQHLERQIYALRTAGCDRIYHEKLSGKKDQERPELTRMLNELIAGDIVVVQKLDRLGRSLQDLINITEHLRDNGVSFISLNENIDTTTPSGRLYFQIIGALAEYERHMILERARDGIRHAKSQGRHLGRKYKIQDADKHYQEAVMSGMSMKDMQERFGVNRSNIYRALKRMGLYELYKTKKPGS